MKRRLLIAVGLVLLIVAAGLSRLLITPTPVAYLRVVDTNNHPIANALITPDGLRPKKGGGHYGWNFDYPRSGVKAQAVRTDANGYAAVPYPFYVTERLETGEISFAVDHPDFCADRPFRTVATAPPQNASFKEKSLYLLARVLRQVQARPDPVKLKAGGTIIVTGYVGAPDNILTNTQVMISNLWPAGTNYWQRHGPELWTHKAIEGKTFLRALACRDGQATLFSDVVTLDVKPGQTNRYALELRPGVRVEGKLDATVPRPIAHGRICIHAYMDQQDGNSEAPIWSAWSPLDAEGRFVLESVPEGRLEIMALCDGALSQNGTSSAGSGQRIPQSFDLRRPKLDLIILMERAAACEITVS